MIGIAGVIEEDQQPPIGEHRPVQRGLRIGRLRNLRRRDAQWIQEAAERLGRRERDAAWVVAAQVHIELTVGELARHLDGPSAGPGPSCRCRRCR